MNGLELPSGYVPVLNYGYVALIDSMGGDLSVVNSARVSFGKKVEELGEADIGLIGYLMKQKHGTPFEQNSFTFHVKCPIFVMREWIRHRISSVNEFSMRYTEAPAEWYVPAIEDVRGQVGKPGHYTYETMHEQEAQIVRVNIDHACKSAFDLYKELLEFGVAKELARTVLPVAMYTEFYWTINARSLMNFLSLRNAPQALREIHVYADIIEDLWREKMPFTAAAFLLSDRKAP